MDEAYDAIFVDFGKWLCRRLWTVDAKGVDGAVNGASALTVFMSRVSAKFDFRGVDGLVNAIADLIQGGSQTSSGGSRPASCRTTSWPWPWRSS